LVSFQDGSLVILSKHGGCLNVEKIKTYQEFFLFFLSRLVIEATGLNDLVVNIKLIPGPLVHSLFHALLRDKPQDEHSFGLTDTVSTILGLQIGVGIPITVEAIKRVAPKPN
jgi:hypothetical protein